MLSVQQSISLSSVIHCLLAANIHKAHLSGRVIEIHARGERCGRIRDERTKQHE